MLVSLVPPENPIRRLIGRFEMSKLPCTQRLLHRRNGVMLVRVLLGFVLVAGALHLIIGKLSVPEPRLSGRRRFDLMPNARCVPLLKNHLDPKYMKDKVCFSRRQIQQIITDLPA